jgi:hypothetical protein
MSATLPEVCRHQRMIILSFANRSLQFISRVSTALTPPLVQQSRIGYVLLVMYVCHVQGTHEHEHYDPELLILSNERILVTVVAVVKLLHVLMLLIPLRTSNLRCRIRQT